MKKKFIFLLNKKIFKFLYFNKYHISLNHHQIFGVVIWYNFIKIIFGKWIHLEHDIILINIKINKNKELKVCLCTICQKENLYASEFVEHYKKIGYDKIFIYDNNNVGDEKFEEVLSKQISNNFVEIINYKGYRGKRQSPQSDAFIDCYEKTKIKK